MTDHTMRRGDMPHEASDLVPAHDAQEYYESDGVEFSVSGDMTRKGYGTIGFRRNRGPALFKMPGVRPRTATTGIRVGDTIELHGSVKGTVTRVGSIAGFFTVTEDPYGIYDDHRLDTEQRWDVASVTAINPAK